MYKQPLQETSYGKLLILFNNTQQLINKHDEIQREIWTLSNSKT